MTNCNFVLVSHIANRGLRFPSKTYLALAVFTVMTSSVLASPIEFGKASFRLSSKETLFTQPHTAEWMMAAMSDTPSRRRADRNMPWLEIQNDSVEGVNLTEFHLTIGDERFHFSNDHFENFTVISPTSSFQDTSPQTGDNRDELVVMFNDGGLAPGQKVRFRIEIGVDAHHTTIRQQWPHPDFRTVLFDINGIDAYGPTPTASRPSIGSPGIDAYGLTPLTAPGEDQTDNSSGYGVFRKGQTIVQSTRTTLPDYLLYGPTGNVFNQHFRSWAGPEEVHIFGADVTAMVPEPGSFLLSALGIAVVSLVIGRRPSGMCERKAYGNHTANYRRRHAPRPRLHTTCRHRKLRNATR
jgi:hypothetical protein